MNKPQPTGILATGDKAIAAAAALFAHSPQDQDDQREEADDLTFCALLQARDEASEAGDWMGCNELDAELRSRRLDAYTALHKLFIGAVETNTTVPMVEDRKLSAWSIADYLAEALDTNTSHHKLASLILRPQDRERVLRELAHVYANEQGESLLIAGFEVPQ